jgi:hypothetical protein
MGELSIELAGGKTSFAPGESIRGTAGWRLEVPHEGLEVRLFWYTEGKGQRDVDIVETVTLDRGSREGSHGFTFTAPQAPLSFSGKLISLIWAIEIVKLSDGEAGRLEITISHSGEEIRIGTPETDELDHSRMEPSS